MNREVCIKNNMKHITLALVFILATAFCFAQKAATVLITVKIKNTSILPKNVTIISYQPGETGNGTNGVFLMPGSEKKFQFKEGTKIYIANAKQVDTVMSGQRIDNGIPFLTVKKDDNNKVFNL
jgi:predicted RecA/RadA family phage recombinase